MLFQIKIFPIHSFHQKFQFHLHYHMCKHTLLSLISINYSLALSSFLSDDIPPVNEKDWFFHLVHIDLFLLDLVLVDSVFDLIHLLLNRLELLFAGKLPHVLDVVLYFRKVRLNVLADKRVDQIFAFFIFNQLCFLDTQSVLGCVETSFNLNSDSRQRKESDIEELMMEFFISRISMHCELLDSFYLSLALCGSWFLCVKTDECN